jgi:hypothetical protein
MVTTVDVKDAAGVTRTVNTLPALGNAAKSAALPATLASDDPVTLAAASPYNLSVAVGKNASSGVVANATASAAIAAAASKKNYCSGVDLTGLGATAAGSVNVTLAGILGGTMTWVVEIPAGVGLGIQGLELRFNPPLEASAANTAITFSAGAFGAGNTKACANIYGFQI